MVKGIDVSKWQGDVDFEKVRNDGYSFVIINAGYGKYISQKDPFFDDNYRKAKAAGLGVGAYWYSYATDVDGARQEADVFLQAVKGKQFDYPLAFDIEDSSQLTLPKIIIGDMVEAFCGRLEECGCYASLYSYASFLNEKVPDYVRAKYDIWVAAFDVDKPSYSGTYGMWQYTSSGRVGGISGDCDLDYAYKDYPLIMSQKGLNGYAKSAQSESKTEVKGDVNGDGKVNSADIVALAAHIKGKKKLE